MRNWIVTGISSGIGKALAEKAIEEGDFVFGSFRKQEQVNAFNRQMEGKAKAALLDLTQAESIGNFVKQALSELQEVDVLVNNAGIGFVGSIEESSIEEVRLVFEANFFGPLLLTQQLLTFFRKQQRGHIIQLSSHGGITAFAGFGIYNASKFALEGFSEALSKEINPLGLALSIVEPGPFRTEFAGVALKEAKNIIDAYNTTAGAFRSKLKQVHGKQEGDPAKAARAIWELSLLENPPQRLILGKTALASIEQKVNALLSDLENSREIALDSIFKD